MERVLKEDPLSQMWHYNYSETLQGLGLDDEALAAVRKAVELDPHFWLGWWWQGMLLSIHGRRAEARDCAEKAMAGASWSPYSIGLMAGVLTHAGETERAEGLLADLRGDAYAGPVGLACYHLVRGAIDSAVDWSRKAVEQRFPAVIILVICTFEPRLRQSAGWPALLKTMNLPND
jgi:Flp pilus assembly protein TadD